MDPLLALSFNTFSSVWYWIMTGLIWSSTCHYTLGVPYDLLVSAHQRGGKYAIDAEELARIHIDRVVIIFRKSGTLIVVFVSFLLAILATFGFVYRYEMAQGAFMLAAPLTLVHGAGVALAFRLKDAATSGSELRAALTRRRFWNQVIGLSAIFCGAVLTFFAIGRNFSGW